MAKADVWMPLYVGDYLRDTPRFGAAEHGAYLMLIMALWIDGELPDDDEELCRIARCKPAEWRKIRQKIAGFFAISGGVWRHTKVDRVKADAVGRADAAEAKARRAAEARWSREKTGPGDASSIAPSNARRMPQALPGAVLEQCPKPSPSSVPSEQASETPDGRAWREAVALLTASGGMKESAARALFGKLLRDNKLAPSRMLGSLATAYALGTQDPQAYLTAAARRLASGGGDAKAAINVTEWTHDVWRAALAGFDQGGRWDDGTMGPRPGLPGCLVPPDLMVERRAAA